MLATDAAPHLFWITSRAAGIAALMLSSASVGLGDGGVAVYDDDSHAIVPAAG